MTTIGSLPVHPPRDHTKNKRQMRRLAMLELVATVWDGQTGRPARPQREKGRGVLCLYVEPLIDARTKLEACFTIPG